MKFYTEISNMVHFLVKVYKNRGRNEFLANLRTYSYSTIEHKKDSYEIGRLLSFLSLQILSQILSKRQEEIMETVFDISDKIRPLKNRQKMIELFVNEIDRKILDIELDSNQISDKVILYLKRSSINELKQITSESISDKFNYSKFHFSRKFNKEKGYSIHDAILYEKMNRAFQMLEHDNYSIKQVSETFGFSDPQYFTKVFKKTFSITPSSLLKLSQE